MKDYPNFYENLKEAQMRLQGTVVCYDGEPYFVHSISDHKPDGIFRIYLYPVDYYDTDKSVKQLPDIQNHLYGGNHPSTVGDFLDKYVKENPTTFLRKRMDSSYFYKFRPFPLGMINQRSKCYYIERQPLRKTEQGLINSALVETPITLDQTEVVNARINGRRNVELASKAFIECVKGTHPTAQSVVNALLDPSVENSAHAFHRHFALVRGPLEMLFMAYKTDIVGVLPNNDLSVVKLGKQFKHLREVTTELGVFGSIN